MDSDGVDGSGVPLMALAGRPIVKTTVSAGSSMLSSFKLTTILAIVSPGDNRTGLPDTVKSPPLKAVPLTEKGTETVKGYAADNCSMTLNISVPFIHCLIINHESNGGQEMAAVACLQWATSLMMVRLDWDDDRKRS